MRHLFEIVNLKRTKLRVFSSLLLMAFCLLVSMSVSAQKVNYHIKVKTANEKGAASDNDISLDIHGEWGSTGAFNIKGNKTQGGTDEFVVNKLDVGKISKIVLKYKKAISENWKCEYIHITKGSTRHNRNTDNGYYEFNENSWFGGKKLLGTSVYDIYPDYSKHAKPLSRTNNMTTTQVPYLGKTDRGNGITIYNFETITKPIELSKVERGKRQQPRVYLNFVSSIGTYKDQRYINVSLAGSRVAADLNGNLCYDSHAERGYYLEEANVEIRCLTNSFNLPSYGPNTDQSEGSVSSSSGIDLQMGSAISKDGGESSINTGVNFGMTYSSNLKAFSVEDNTSGTVVKTKYKLTSTNTSDTWSNPLGGNSPYQEAKDLIRMDAAGQFGGTPLNFLPDLAMSNLPVASMGTFKAPNNYAQKALFEVKIHLRLMYMKQKNMGFSVNYEPVPVDYTVIERFEVDFGAIEPTPTTCNGTWNEIASENQTLQFSGSKLVRYGANGKFVTKVVASGTKCNNGTFSDPAPGVPKKCSICDNSNTPKTNTIALKTVSNHYISAKDGGGSAVAANRTKVGRWETFTMEELGNNKVALKTHTGHYLSAKDGGGSTLAANRTKIGRWETFTKIDLGNNKIALKTHTGHYVVAENNNGNIVNANRTRRGSLETFTVERR